LAFQRKHIKRMKVVEEEGNEGRQGELGKFAEMRAQRV
jgi:hypothetical protein